MQEQDTPPGFWTRLGRSIRRVLRFVLLLVILSALGVILVLGGQQAIGEVSRSFDNINKRFDIQGQQIEGLQSDVDALLQTDASSDEALRALRLDVTRQASRLEDQETTVNALRRELAADLAQQADLLATLTARMTENEQIAAELGGSVAALQGDLNANGRRIDELGGELDTLSSELTQSQAALRAEYATPGEEVAAVMASLRYFRVWEVVARSRLRLVENNPGLAQADAALALSIVADLRAVDETAASDLAAVQDRLTLAEASLPANPVSAARDLEAAWEVLDRLLGLLLLPALPPTETPAASDVTPTPPPATVTPLPSTPTSPPAITATPAPTATP